jgi:hypothetical protein
MKNYPQHLTHTSASMHRPIASPALTQQLQLSLLTALILGSLVSSGMLWFQTVTLRAIAMIPH